MEILPGDNLTQEENRTNLTDRAELEEARLKKETLRRSFIIEMSSNPFPPMNKTELLRRPCWHDTEVNKPEGFFQYLARRRREKRLRQMFLDDPDTFMDTFRIINDYFLPISLKDAQPEIALSFKTFICFVLLSVNDMPPQAYFALQVLCCSFLSYQAKNMTTPFESFDFQFGNSTNAPQSLLSFGEAFAKFFPEMTHITKFMLSYLLTLILAWPLQVGVQIFIVLLLISAPLYYFPQLVAKASGANVACGSFKMPLILFTTLGAFGISLICVLLTLVVVYLGWRYIYEGRPRVKEPKIGVDDLLEILEVVN